MKEILYAVLVLGIMGAVFGAVLAIASKVFAVKTDERLPKLIEALPGANCGGCGFAGCQAYAQAVLEGRAEIGLCVAGGQASADRMAAVMGVTAAKTERVVAMVRCRGHHTAKARYDGIHDCRSAMFVGGNGPSACPSGCLGFGSCVSVCRFDAIHVVDGVAKVDPEKCTGCLQCAAVCPRKVIVPVSYDADILLEPRARRLYPPRVRYGLRRLPPVREAVRVRRHPRCQQSRRHRLFQVRLLRPLRGRVPAEAHLRFEPPAGYGRRPRHAAIKAQPPGKEPHSLALPLGELAAQPPERETPFSLSLRLPFRSACMRLPRRACALLAMTNRRCMPF